MICQLPKDKMGYDFGESRNTILCLFTIYQKRLIQKKISSGTQVDEDKFKTILKKFKKEIEKQAKFYKAVIVKHYKIT